MGTYEKIQCGQRPSMNFNALSHSATFSQIFVGENRKLCKLDKKLLEIIPTSSIIRTLNLRVAERAVIIWIENLLVNHIISAFLLGDTVCVRAGCPWGGVLSPIFWCLVVHCLLNEINIIRPVVRSWKGVVTNKWLCSSLGFVVCT